MDWDEIEHNHEFVTVQEDLAQFLKAQTRPLTTREIKLRFGDRFLGDALQTLEAIGRIASTGGVLLPKYVYIRDEVKPERLKTCYQCGKMANISDFEDPETKKLAKTCSVCRRYRKRGKKNG